MTASPAIWPRQTLRMTLRGLQVDDVPALLAIRRKSEVGRWLFNDMPDSRSYLEQMSAVVADPLEHEAVAVFEDQVIGNAGITVTPARRQASSLDGRATATGDIGYILDPAYAGRGLATEIVRELLVVAFTVLDLHRVTADCLAGNVGSWRVLEKAGLRREARLVGSAWHTELGWVDEYGYAILRDEWRSRQPEADH